jgi:hypothetical protein
MVNKKSKKRLLPLLASRADLGAVWIVTHVCRTKKMALTAYIGYRLD